MIRITSVLVVVVLLSACAGTPPTPYDVSRSCERRYVELEGRAHGSSPGTYREKVDARCIDDEEHREDASDTLTRSRGTIRKEATYDARDGDNRVGVETDVSVGRGYKSKTAVAGESKRVRWGWDVTVEVRR